MAKEIRHVRVQVSSNAATSMSKGTAAAGGLSASLKGVQASAMAATGGIRAMTMALISSGVGAVVVAIGALTAGMVAVTKKSMDFAKQMSDLKAVLGEGGTAEAMSDLADDAKRLGAQTAFTAVQVGELQVEFAKLGFTKDEILNVTEATLNLAAAAGTDLSEAATVAGSTLRAFGLGSQETARVVDVMSKSFSTSSLDLEKFKESMKLVAPIAKSVKVPIEEASAALAVLANNGLSGSMAGTQLKRIMSDLAQKTGKDFSTSMEIVKDRLAGATSDAEKLAIAKEMVGDRAKGALLILAEQTEVMNELTKSYENAQGAAAEMAETKLDNLTGDITKLSSAWDGFMLSLEDGEGMLNKIARGAVRFLTFYISGFTKELQVGGVEWDFYTEAAKMGATNTLLAVKALVAKFAVLMAEMKLAAADVPLVGELVDEDRAKAQVKRYTAVFDGLKSALKSGGQDMVKLYEDSRKKVEDIRSGAHAKQLETEASERALANEEFIEGEVNSDESARNKILENRKKFLEKLTKMEEDADDEGEIAKIERKRQRHLAELDTLKYNEEQKREIAERINAYYDELREEKKADIIKKFAKKYGELDPMAKLEEQKAADLLELEQLEISETEKQELRLRLEEYYAGRRKQIEDRQAEDVAKAEQAKIDAAERTRQERIRMTYDMLDTVAKAAGEESKIARAAQAIKLTMQLAELAQKINIERQKLIARATTAQAEASIDGGKAGVAVATGMAESAKVGFPANLLTIAAYAAQAVGLISAFKQSKKKLDATTGSAGGGSSTGTLSSVNFGGSSSAPSFNVLGQTSAGENMIANAIGNANSTPVRAYVVENEVTSAQQLARNAAISASMG